MHPTFFSLLRSRTGEILCTILLSISIGFGQDLEFQDVTNSAGVSAPNDPDGFGHAVVAADFTGDGRTDLYHVAYTALNSLFRNNGNGTFSDIASQAGVQGTSSLRDRGAAAVDYDNDGDVDIYIASSASMNNLLYRNNGNGTFSEVAGSAGLSNISMDGQGVSWGDYDNDGDLDLFLASYNSSYRLFRQNSDHTFSDVSSSVGIDGVQQSVQAVFFDVERDGDLDLFVSRGENFANKLYLNNGNGSFAEHANSFGLADPSPHGQGITVIDYDLDGDLDLYMSNSNGVNRLYRNEGGSFTEVAASAGVDDGSRSLGCHFADFNNDGWPDLYVINFGTNRLYHNNGDGTFSDVTSGSGAGNSNSGFGSVVTDYDGDGQLDVFFSNSGQNSNLLRNTGNGGNWLRVELAGINSNRNGVGARILVDSNGQRQLQQLVAGYAMVSGGGDLRFHFGLGNSNAASRIEVIWPSGVRDTLINVAANQTITIQEGSTSINDADPPDISSVGANNLTQNSALIQWLTDEPSDSQVEYGLTNNYGNATPLNSNLLTSHAITLQGLLANTTYHFRVLSRDAAGNLAVSDNFVFTTTDQSPLLSDDFSGSSINSQNWSVGTQSGNQAQVSNGTLLLRSSNSVTGWIVSKSAYVGSDKTASVKVVQPSDDGDLAMTPTINLSNLHGSYDEQNWYRYYVYRNNHSGPYLFYVQWKKAGVVDGLDVTGNLNLNAPFWIQIRTDASRIYFDYSPDGSSWITIYDETFDLPGYSLDDRFHFALEGANSGSNGDMTLDDFVLLDQTGSPGDLDPPVISAVTASNLTTTTADITWQTDELSDSQVEYGLDTNYGSLTTLDSVLVTNHAVSLSGLTAGTLYHYRVLSRDAAGNLAESTDFTFTTEQSPPPGGLSFSDITNSAGTGGPTGSGTGGHAAIWSDVDSDSRPDLYITMLRPDDNPVADLFFRNDGGNVFSDEAAVRGIDDFDGGSHGACFADLDNDGDFDLYNGTTAGAGSILGSNDVFRNDGNGLFTDVTGSTGIPVREWGTRAVVAFDMDSDGDLDLFAVTNYQGSNDPPGETNDVYRNDGNLQFTAINSGDLFNAPAGQGATDTDYDGDGDIDVFAANRTGDVNILRNDGSGNFVLITPAALGISHQAKDGITTADIDNDGDFDLMLAGDDEGFLYINDGDGTFTFRQSFSNTNGYMGGFADLDNDTDLDLVFAGDEVSYLNDGSGNFSTGPSIPVSGIDDPRAVGFADIDNDGDMDFAFGCKRSRNWLVRNNLDSGNWLKVELISPQGQAGAFGAKVKVFPAGQAGGPQIGLREARSNNGYLGQDDPILHFGLGSQTSVDVVVDFLDGNQMTLTSVSGNQTILINGAGSDITPPIISAVTASNLDTSSADITWETDELSDSQVEYGLDTNYGTFTPLDSALVTNHAVSLASLTAGTLYHYRVRSRDAAGNLAISADDSFSTATGDIDPPVISAVTASNLTTTTADINWETDELSDSQVEYGLDTNYGTFTPLDSTLVTNHAVSLSSLTAGTIYHYRVRSRDAAGNLAVSAGDSFSTAAGDLDPPIISAVTASNLDTSSADITWQTDELSDSQVEYGLDTNYGTFTPLDSALVTNHAVSLAGLTAGTLYHYRVLSRDVAGNLAVSAGDSFSTAAGDLDPPIISAVTASNLTTTTADINWETDELSDSQVEYGLDTNYGTFTPLDSALVSNHAVSLAGLTAGTLYHYRVRSRDAAGNLAISAGDSFTTSRHSILLADDFSGSTIDPQKWNVGQNSGNESTLDNGRLKLQSSGRETGWIVTRNSFIGKNKNAKIMVVQPNEDGDLAVTPTINLSNQYGSYNENNWYRFYLYRNGGTGPYLLYVQWNKNGTTGGFDVTGSLTISAPCWLRIRTDASRIYFEFSSDNVNWVTTHDESFALPGYTLSDKFFYAIEAASTTQKGIMLVDDFELIDQSVGGGDTQPPIISGVNAGNITASAATITWTTDELSDSQVEYGLDTNYGNLSPLNSTLVTNHSIALAGLSAGTVYHYRVLSRDAAGNLAASGGFTFSTDAQDVTPPKLSSIQATNIGNSTATITWETDEPGDSQVEYGLDTNYGTITPLDPALITSHAVKLAGLQAGTLYHYRVSSRDAAGNLAVSNDFTFTTSSGQPRNVALLATATASTQNAGTGQTADKAIDGVADGYPGDHQKEWATLKELNGAWLHLDFPQSFTIDRAVIYDRPNLVDHVLNADLSFSNGTTVQTGSLSNDGSGVTVTFSPRNVEWMQFTVTSASGENIGLAEIEVWEFIASPPVISSVAANAISESSATITWTTDKTSDSQVEYGLDSNYGSLTPIDPALVKNHAVPLSNLASGTRYHYRVLSRDSSGSLATSSDFSFTTGTIDTMPPVISAVAANSITPTSAVISWLTDEASSSQVEFSLDTSFVNITPLDTTKVTQHAIQLSGLLPDTIYHYRVLSMDVLGNFNKSDGDSFRTLTAGSRGDEWPVYSSNPFVIPAADPVYKDQFFVADLNGDSLMDFSYRSMTHLYVYGHYGALLWSSEIGDPRAGIGFGGTGHGAADIDGDGETEIVALDDSNHVWIFNGSDGVVEDSLALPVIGSRNRWVCLALVNLRGMGDRDMIAQTLDTTSSFQSSFINRSLIALDLSNKIELWRVLQDDDHGNGIYEGYWGPAHGSFQCADVDQDGLDEVVGANLIDHDGTVIELGYPRQWLGVNQDGFTDHLDCVSIGDYRPDLPGLEWIVTEEDHAGGTDWHTTMMSTSGVIWRKETALFSGSDQEPQNVAGGNFNPDSSYSEIWVRSRFAGPVDSQHPWLYDALGQEYAHYSMGTTLAPGFNNHPNGNKEGIEMISTIDWDGSSRDYLAAKARHISGNIGVFHADDGATVWDTPGDFPATFASLIYAVDIAGDSREEVVIYDTTGSIRIYWNAQPNVNAPEPRKWNDPLYRRLKQNWNYYSPGGYTRSSAIYASRVLSPVAGNLAKTSAPDFETSEIPAEFTVTHSYPNPFNAETRVLIETPASGRVKAVVYDLQGKQVRTAYDRRAEGGQITVIWNGRNNIDQQVSSGVYFLRVVFEGDTGKRQIRLQRLVLLK